MKSFFFKSISSIVTGRSSLKDWLYKNYPEFYQYLISNFSATVRMKPSFPYFQILFRDYEKAKSFAEELENRTER